MASSSRASPSKRALESLEDDAQGKSQGKRPRIVSDISEASEQEEIENRTNVVKQQAEGTSPTVVIYELSSDNDESLLNASEKQSSNEASPARSDGNAEDKQEESAEESDVEMKSDSDGDSDNEEEDDSEEEEGTTSKESAETKERKVSFSSVDEIDGTLKEKQQEKRKRLESSDYNTKTMEDLEYLQEDLHKELAEITEKSFQKRKHKKTSSSSHHREKRHKEKTRKDRERVKDDDTRDRHKDRTKERERDKQRTAESRSDYKREVKVGVRRDYDKVRKYEDDKPWSYDSRRARSEKDERKDRGERHWMQTRLERSPSKIEIKSVVERKVRKEPKTHKEEESRGKEIKPSQSSKEAKSEKRDARSELKEMKTGQSLKDTKSGQVSKESKLGQKAKEAGKEPVKKGIMSESIREMVRQSMRENKGLAQEVVEEDSDESPEHFFPVQTSDVSSATESEEEPEEEPEEKENSPEVPKLPPYLPAIEGCRSVEEFQWLNRIEEGTYGVVYRAKDKRTGEVVALKKLKMEKEKEGFPITSLREINTLLKAQHPNIVTVQEIVVGSNMDKIYIVMDFVEHDLKALMETMTQPFLAGEIKTVMIQLLRAINHLHDNWILHRDIKTSNLLLSNKGILKVGDFGLAREYGSPLKPYTPIVVTLWYRAPELLLGAKEYSTPIDIWSVGCVFGELLTMKPLFNGQSEISQINKIFKELGTPSDKIWPGPPAYSELPATKKMTFAEHPYNNLRNRFGATLTDKGFDLLNSFLTYDPSRRILAEDALKHDYFKEAPSPVDPSLFPSWPARSEGAKRAKKASPKAPEGGNFYKSLSEDGDSAFHLPAGKSQGKTAGPGFILKF